MSWTRERARLAVTIRDHPDDHAAIEQARRDLRAARAEAYVRELVDTSPPLTAEQRSRLAVLLLAFGVSTNVIRSALVALRTEGLDA
jgi:hypothetical protein